MGRGDVPARSELGAGVQQALWPVGIVGRRHNKNKNKNNKKKKEKKKKEG